MTTKFSDNKICNFKSLLSWRFPQKKKTAFWTIFLSAPKAPPPLKNRKFYFYCRLSVSETLWRRFRSFFRTLFALFVPFVVLS